MKTLPQTMLVVGVMVLIVPGVVMAQFGANISYPEPLNNDAATDNRVDRWPQVKTDYAGNWVAIWHAYDPVEHVSDIMAASSTDNGVTWTDPRPLHANSASPYHAFDEGVVQLTTDSAGIWLAIWYTQDPLDNTIGFDEDILVSRSTDIGATWTDPQPLNSNAAIDTGDDSSPGVTTDNAGNWVAVWASTDSLGNTIGNDVDILVARSTDNGVTWTAPAPLDTNAATDLGPDSSPEVTTDNAGNWVAVWSSRFFASDPDIAVARSTDNGATWTDPQPLGNPATFENDHFPQVTTDYAGNWVAVWQSLVLGFPESDIAVARSTDNGATWTDPQFVNTNWLGDTRQDLYPQVTTDNGGNWVVLWRVGPDGFDWDVRVARSTDNGATWTDPHYLNTNGAIDTAQDWSAQVTTDNAGHWVAVWWSDDIGLDGDILVARFVLGRVFVDPSVYGRFLFPPLWSQDATFLPGGPGEPHAFDDAFASVYRRPNDRFFLSSEGMRFAPLVVDESVHIDGNGAGLGPYEFQPGVDPLDPPLNAPVESILVPLPAHEVTDLIPFQSTEPILFELLDTQREIYGNTAVYLIRDCGVYLGKEPDTTIHWVSHDVEVEGFQSDLDVASGLLSELRADQDFSRACDLGSFLDTTQAIDSRPDPAPSEGYYYLVSGTCAQPIGYGNSSLGQRTGLPPPTACP